MINITNITIFALIVCISGIASAQDVDKKKDRQGRDFSGNKRMGAKLLNKRMLGQLELSDEQKKSIGQVMRESQAEFQELRKASLNKLRDPETAAARKELIKQLKDEGKTKQEIKDAVREKFASDERPQLDENARNELIKSFQEFQAKTTEKIKAILTDQQRVAFEQLIQEQRNARRQGNPGKRKGKKNRGKDNGSQKKDKGGDFDI